MFETHVTVVGNLVTAVDSRRFADGTVLATFRICSKERRFDKASEGWVDGDRLFVDVSCRRQLAENAVASLVKGDPVVVTGRLYTRNFEHDGQRRSTMTLDARSVAADLAWCTAVVTRTGQRATGSGDTAAADIAGDPRPTTPPELVSAAPGGGG